MVVTSWASRPPCCIRAMKLLSILMTSKLLHHGIEDLVGRASRSRASTSQAGQLRQPRGAVDSREAEDDPDVRRHPELIAA